VTDWAVTHVWFAPMGEREIEAYVESGEPLDKAGAYAIQGLASKFIERIDGCYFNVVGLPVAMVYRYLRENRA
jgi:septum formation protein